MPDPVTKVLRTPLPPTVTEVAGMSQTDVIVRTAIVAALADLRANPWLLDYCFAHLPGDELSMRDYGEMSRRQAREWFLSQDVKVMLGLRPPEGAQLAACVTVAPMADEEDKNTLGDIHYTPREEIEAEFADLTAPFTPVSYTSLTGTIVVPDTIASKVSLTANTMAFVDGEGRRYEIEEVLDDTTCRIAAGTTVDLSGCTIRPTIPSLIVGIESQISSESFMIGCHTTGEPQHLLNLYSVVKFCLLRYRQALLEARGFGESRVAGRDISQVGTEDGQLYMTRFMTLTGNVRNAWPKLVTERILTTISRVAVMGGENVPLETGQLLSDMSWIGDKDSIG